MPTARALNADCVDLIAEFACASVAAACTLRSASRAWRAAVDDRVRALVALDQAMLNAWITAAPDADDHDDGGPVAPPSSNDHARDHNDDWCAATWARAPFYIAGVRDDCPEMPIFYASEPHPSREWDPEITSGVALRACFALDGFDRTQRLVIVALHLAGDCGSRGCRHPEACGPRPLLGVAVRHWTTWLQQYNPAVACVGELAVGTTPPDPSAYFRSADGTTPLQALRRLRLCAMEVDSAAVPLLLANIPTTVECLDIGMWGMMNGGLEISGLITLRLREVIAPALYLHAFHGISTIEDVTITQWLGRRSDIIAPIQLHVPSTASLRLRGMHPQPFTAMPPEIHERIAAVSDGTGCPLRWPVKHLLSVASPARERIRCVKLATEDLVALASIDQGAANRPPFTGVTELQLESIGGPSNVAAVVERWFPNVTTLLLQFLQGPSPTSYSVPAAVECLIVTAKAPSEKSEPLHLPDRLCLRRCRHLRVFKTRICRPLFTGVGEALSPVADTIVELEFGSPVQNIATSLHRFTSLRTLNGEKIVEGLDISEGGALPASLETLTLPKCKDPATIGRIAAQCPRLLRLSHTASPMPAGSDVSALIKRCPRLCFVEGSGIPRWTSADDNADDAASPFDSNERWVSAPRFSHLWGYSTPSFIA